MSISREERLLSFSIFVNPLHNRYPMIAYCCGYARILLKIKCDLLCSVNSQVVSRFDIHCSNMYFKFRTCLQLWELHGESNFPRVWHIAPCAYYRVHFEVSGRKIFARHSSSILCFSFGYLRSGQKASYLFGSIPNCWPWHSISQLHRILMTNYNSWKIVNLFGLQISYWSS